MKVMASERSTVFLRPILFMSMPVGTEKIRNQKKTSEGKILADASEAEVFLYIVGGGADKVDESHGKEAEHHGNHLSHSAFACSSGGSLIVHGVMLDYSALML